MSVLAAIGLTAASLLAIACIVLLVMLRAERRRALGLLDKLGQLRQPTPVVVTPATAESRAMREPVVAPPPSRDRLIQHAMEEGMSRAVAEADADDILAQLNNLGLGGS